MNGKGKDIALKLEDGTRVKDGLLHLRKRTESFTFTGVAERPVPSLLREFSAPVKLDANLTDGDLEFLIAHDSDQFNRWQAAQTLAMKTLKEMTAARLAGSQLTPSPRFAEALGRLVSDESLEPAFRAAMLIVPATRDIMLAIGADVDPKAAYKARRAFRESLGNALRSELESLYGAYAVKGQFSPDADSAGRRALRNAALSLLTIADGSAGVGRLRDHFKHATNMTDSMAALDGFSEIDTPERDTVLQAFYKRWKKDALVLDKWFSVQARSPVHGTAAFVSGLTQHRAILHEEPQQGEGGARRFRGR